MRTLALFIITLALSQTASAQHELWYQQPAQDWNQALPVGNGRLGAMVFGNPDNERIQLNEDSVWAEPDEQVNSKGTPADLKEIRNMLDQGKLVEADKFIVRKFSLGKFIQSQQTLGDLHIDWNDTEKPFVDYRRSLDLETAISTTTWKRGEATYTQEVFASNPDEVIFIRLTTVGPDTLNFDIRLDRPQDENHTTHTTTASSDSSLQMTGQVTQREAIIDGKELPDMKGSKFDSRLSVTTESGKSTAAKNSLQIRNAKSATIRLTASTDFWPKAVQGLHYNNHRESETFEDAKQKHIADHRTLYNRCRLTFPSDSEEALIPTDERLEALQSDNSDPHLEALMFHYGRYLLIASSRSNGNPAHLQGLWNPHIKAPWNSDYHLNINLQMNYWPAEVTNLPEIHAPVFTWMQALAKRGAITAKQQYGMRGWMSHHASVLSASTTMIAAQSYWGSWIHGGGWMCQDIWTHYSYTQDKAFLKETGYPLLSGQARFYLDWLTEKDGKLISYPETSPENSFKTAEGKPVAVTSKAAMGQQIINEVLSNTLAAAKVLGIDDDLTKEIDAALSKLDKGLHIGPDGRLLEWDKPFAETQMGHRHLSHLYAFHPGITVTQEKTPEILEAVKKSIDVREKHGSVGIGWSRSWAISIYARLRDGNTAHKHLHEMLRTQTLSNGFNSVFGKNRPLFQIEANLGATAGIAEMLVQSHGGYLHLLPALPDTWKTGAVTGLKARGGHTIDIHWKDGKLTSATIAKGAAELPEMLLVGKAVEASDPRLIIK